ncbi:MAG: hypothetical protein EPO16_05580 [Dehalococcoidia bacterium]|nr:MAG: hypothetical protein EPO16_05580 [Dehalococcoidia bacterium]
MSLLLAAPSSSVLAAAPDEPAGGTPASCPGVAFSDHATGNADATMREVIHDEVPEIIGLTGMTRGELFKLFAGFHEDSHAGCEQALLDALFS